MSRKFLFVLIVGILPSLSAEVLPDGIYQAYSCGVGSGFAQRYEFKADSFRYYRSEYEGLNPLRYFGGSYYIDGDSVKLNIMYYVEGVYTPMELDYDPRIPIASFGWEKKNYVGDKNIHLKSPQSFVLPIKITADSIVFDGNAYYPLCEPYNYEM